MNYYTAYLPLILDDDDDRSYPSPEMQLLWRLDDLCDVLEELREKDAPYRNGYIYSEDDIRYALPEHLGDISKVECAIELAKADLVNKYGLPDPDELICAAREKADAKAAGQIFLEEYLTDEQPKVA